MDPCIKLRYLGVPLVNRVRRKVLSSLLVPTPSSGVRRLSSVGTTTRLVLSVWLLSVFSSSPTFFVLYAGFQYSCRHGLDNVLIVLIGGVPIAVLTVPLRWALNSSRSMKPPSPVLMLLRNWLASPSRALTRRVPYPPTSTRSTRPRSRRTDPSQQTMLSSLRHTLRIQRTRTPSICL
jgi:hypothetical protein